MVISVQIALITGGNSAFYSLLNYEKRTFLANVLLSLKHPAQADIFQCQVPENLVLRLTELSNILVYLKKKYLEKNSVMPLQV